MLRGGVRFKTLALHDFLILRLYIDTIVPWRMANVDAARTAKLALVVVVVVVVILPRPLLPLPNAPPLATFCALERTSAAVRVHPLDSRLDRLVHLPSPPAAGYTCFRDSANSPKCSPPATTPTYTPPTITPTTTTAQGPPGGLVTTPKSTPTPTPPASGGSGTQGAASSAFSVVVDAFFTVFAGVGMFAYLS